MQTVSRLGSAAALTLGMVLVLSAVVDADTGTNPKCQSAIIKGSGKFVAAKAKALQKCEDNIVKGTAGYSSPPGGRCADTAGKTAATIAKAETSFKRMIDAPCGGADKTCGAGHDDVGLNAVYFDIGPCPGFERKGCTNRIDHCGGVDSDGRGVTDCLLCLDETAIDSAMHLYANGFTSGEFGTGSAINRCQAAIEKESTKFLLTKSKVRGKCWEAVNRGTFAGPCPSGDTSGKTQTALAKAEAVMVAKLCQACGGTDGACDLQIGAIPGSGNTDDLTPAQIGFAQQCPPIYLNGPLGARDDQALIATARACRDVGVGDVNQRAVDVNQPAPPRTIAASSRD